MNFEANYKSSQPCNDFFTTFENVVATVDRIETVAKELT